MSKRKPKNLTTKPILQEALENLTTSFSRRVIPKKHDYVLFECICKGLETQGFAETGGGPEFRTFNKIKGNINICSVRVTFTGDNRDQINVRYSYHKDE